MVRVAFDEQIFAIQRHGGISRVFAELAHEFEVNPEHGVQLQPVNAPIINEYILRDSTTADHLVVRPGRHWATTIARSMARRRHTGPADIVHSTFYLPRMLKDYPQARRIVTIYDMIPEMFPQSRRRLDFLMQELNREANTLTSKSTDQVATACAVEMKVLIEQIREQVQNIE